MTSKLSVYSTALFNMYTLSQFILVLVTAFIHPGLGIGSSVSLTAEGGVSLVGSHCPGTLRLFCEGVDLTILEWKYNDSFAIGNLFSPEDSPTIQTSSNPAFLSVELSHVSSLDVVFANFSSVLTVDLSQLELQNIVFISCGDPLTRDSVLVNVNIKQETVLEDPLLIVVNTSVVYDNDRVYGIFSLLWKKV